MSFLQQFFPDQFLRLKASISNPVALEIAVTALEACWVSQRRYSESIDKILFRCDEEWWFAEGNEYLLTSVEPTDADRETLHRRLLASGLAARLLDGESSLPDIYPAMPPLLRFIERFAHPRKARDVTRLVLRYMDWYLDPTERVLLKLPWRDFGISLLLSTGIAAPFALIALFSGEPFPDFSIQTVYGPLWVTMLLSLLTMNVTNFYIGAQDQVAAQEFFNYLWQTFTASSLPTDE